MKNIFAILFICVLMMPLFGQNDGIVPPTSTRTRIQLSEQARLSKTPLQFLITDANKKIKYWNKDTVFVNFFKINVDSLIRNYNDTVVKGGTPCRDSMYLIGNTLYHKSAYCAIQSAVIMPECTDSLWKIGADIWHRNTACQVQNFTVIEGCQGARTYFKASIGDTIGLSPSPVCGDLLVIDSDTCKDVLYVRGSLPVKWNYVGAYLKNENCFDFPVCKDSVWRSGKQIYHRNIDCNIQSFTDSNNVDYKFTSVGATGENVLKDTLDRNIKFRKIQGLGATKVTLVSDVITIQDTSTFDRLDTLRTTIADDTQFQFTHSPYRTSFVTITAGAGVKYTNFSPGAGNANGATTIEVDTAHQKFNKLRKIYSIANVGTGSNDVYRDSTVSGDLTTFNLRRPVSANTNLDIAVSGSNLLFTVNSDSLANIGTGSSVYKPAPSGTNPKVFNLRKLNGTGGVTVTENSNDISIGYTNPTPGVCTSLENPHVYDLNVVTGNGIDPKCLKIDRCNWNLTPTLSSGTLNFVVLDDDDGLSLTGCLYTKSCNCTLAYEAIEDPDKLLVQNGTDLQGLFLSMIDVINRQGQRISDLENPPSDNIVQISDRGTISTMQVARRVYEQQKTIDAQQNTINQLIERLEKLEKR